MTVPGRSPGRSPTATRAVAAAYGAQGLGYAAVVTSLPGAKDRLDLTDAAVSALLLGVCVAAALGSVLADVVAVRRGSRVALCLGFALQLAALAGMALAPPLAAYVGVVVAYGLGLGAVDAGTNMQGVALQARAGTPLLGRMYAVLTAGGVLGALLATGAAAIGLSPAALVGAVAVVDLGIVLAGRAWFLAALPAASGDPGRDGAPGRGRPPLPRAAIAAVGSLVAVAYALDAAVSTWSAVYLADGLAAADAVVPTGYAAYLATVLLARLLTDAAVRRWGRRLVGLAAVGVGTTGCGLVVAGNGAGSAVLGFALAGVATGAMVPIAFAAAGQLLPERSDEVVARVNVFNYAGAVTGAVVPGVVGAGAALRFGFLAPALALLLVLPVVRRLPARVSASSAPLQPAPEGGLP